VPEWYQPLKIEFTGEQGLDVGGLVREFFLVASQQMLDPNRILFQKAMNQTTFQPSILSAFNENSSFYHTFAGKFVAKAICDNMVCAHLYIFIFNLCI
jgi:E3 ubiquitin-protein ligase HUWE1